jgi:hypothetical protein
MEMSATIDQAPDGPLVAQLGWRELSETCWTALIEAGLPSELAELSEDLSRRSGRPLRVFAMPTLHTGVTGLAVPFVDDDGIVIDPSILAHAPDLSMVIAHELAHMLYPGWSCLSRDRHEEMEVFARILGPSLLSRLPRRVADAQPMVDVAMDRARI